MKNAIKKWKTLATEMAFDNQYFKVRRDTVQLADDSIVDDFFIWLEGEVVLVVPVTPEGKFVLVRQYKHGGGQIVNEFCAGYIDKGEEPLEAAKRELREETGYSASTFELLGTIVNNPSKSTGKIHVYFARNATVEHETHFDHNENIEVLLKTPDELKSMIRNHEFYVTGSISGAFLALQKLGL